MVPSVGRIVHYRLTEADAARVLLHRRHHTVEVPWSNEHGSGVARHAAFEGNAPKGGDVYPMLITRVWSPEPTEGDCVQGQVFLDGNDSLWVTSVQQQGYTYDPSITEGVWFEPALS